MNKKKIIFYFLYFLILGIFFYFYNYLNIENGSQPLIFNSPDETSNYYFTEHFSKNLNFKEYNSYLSISNDIHPRSIKVSGNYIMPSSFIGLPMIYGFISKFTGIWTIPYMTPIFAIIG
ncbi:MAG: hypothetical protein PHW42_03990, partial [Patescibacteria group bacterium]|nr:hypothetical protein [Patescibacteria group bacterium]